MNQGLVFAGLLAAHTVSGHELTGHTVLLQPIVLTDDVGGGAARANLPEELIDLPFRRWDLGFQILEPVEWSRRAFRDGEIDVDVIVKAAMEEGVFRQPRRIANMFFARKINGREAPNGLGQEPGWVTFIAQSDDPPLGQDAFVVVHEVTHNLGLSHTVDDAEVPSDISNVMGDGDFLDRIREDGITRHQAATILKSPLVRETVKCLEVDEGRRAYLGESFEAYYTELNRREVEAMTGKVVGKALKGEALEKEARKRFENAVMDFTREEREVVLWMVGEYRKLLVEDFPLLANQPWQVVKVKGDHCGGFCHTRGLSVVIAEGALDRMMKDYRQHGKSRKTLAGAGTIIVHEQIHVLQRCFPRKFSGLYTGAYGLVDGKVGHDEWVARNEIQNPDGLEGNRWIVDYEGNYYWLKTILDEKDDPAMMPASFQEAIMPLRKTGETYRVIWRKGGKRPQLVKPNLIRGWKKQFPIHTGHDHPNEIFAYLFQAELTRKIMEEEPSDDMMTKRTMEWARKELR